MMVLMAMGNHWKIIFARCGLLVCSTQIIDVLILMRNSWCAQWESILRVPWEINGVHIKVGANNMGLTTP